MEIEVPNSSGIRSNRVINHKKDKVGRNFECGCGL